MTRRPESASLSARIAASLLVAALGLALQPLPSEAISDRPLLRLDAPAPSAEFGQSVTAAADLNGDGYPDVVVGASGAPGGGAVYIYFGGPSADSTPDVVLSGGTTFGSSVAIAGDVNGDGHPDLVVGDPQFTSSTGRVYIFYGGPSLVSKSSASADVILTGQTTLTLFGSPVAGAGDINGDGYADVVVGALEYNSSQGRSYVFYGGPSLTSKNASSADIILTGEVGTSQFGESVCVAGDLNRDGYADVVVGANGYSGYTGRAYAFYGGPTLSSKGAASADAIFTGDFSFDGFGVAVAGAGDVNGDGYADLLVGASGVFSGSGRAYLFYGGPSIASGTASTAPVILTGAASSNYFGISVSGSGDMNGDGYPDLVIGAEGASSTGRAYVFLGGPYLSSKSALSADLTLAGETPFEDFGHSVSGVGDVDHDGHADVVVGAYGYNGFSGRAYVTAVYPYQLLSPNGGEQWIAGRPATVRWRGHDIADVAVSTDGGATYTTVLSGVGGLETNEISITAPGPATALAKVRVTYAGYFPSRANSDASDGVFRIVDPVAPHAAASRVQLTMNGTAAGNQLGVSVASAGDVNGDGYPDLIVGEIYNDVAGTDAGRAYIFFGGPGADNVPDVTLTGEAALDNFGWSVAGAGDLNGDGYADVIVGSPWHNGSTGRAYVFFGGPSMDSVADLILDGEATNNYFGYSVAGAGDVNGDGFTDVIVGAHGYGTGPIVSTGRAYVYYGGVAPDNVVDLRMQGEGANNDFAWSVAGAGDVNGDGYADVIVGAVHNAVAGANAGRAYLYFGGPAADGIADLTMTGNGPGEFLGWSVAGAGDLDGDGHADVIVGGPSLGPGHAYVYLGGPGLDSNPDLTLAGEAATDLFGNIVASAGDVNGDGFADLIVGAPHNDAGGANAGRAYVFYGGPGMDGLADLALTGAAAGDNFGIAVGRTGDWNGDHFGDLFVGANLTDSNGADAGRAYVYDLKRYQVSTPNGGETWPVGATRTISWAGSEPAALWLSVNGGRSYDLLKSGVGGSSKNSFALRVPHAPTKFARIRVAPSDALVQGDDESDSTFTIQTSVSLLALLAAPAPNRAPGAVVTWSTDPGPADLAGYRLERASGGSGWATALALTRETRFADPTAGPATRYRLFAVNGLGEELMLGEASFRPAAALVAWPNPYRGGHLSITFATYGGAGGGSGPATVSLYDVSGRLVRTIARGDFVAGYQAAAWDGRDDRGRPVATGVYFLRALSAGEDRRLKVVIAK